MEHTEKFTRINIPMRLIKRCNKLAEKNDTSGHEEFFNALERGIAFAEVE